MTQEEIPYRLVRARRRTLAIHILPDGSVEVRAPMQMAESRIRQFVAEKRGWITKKQGETLERQRLRRETRLSPGDSVVLLDRPYRLETAAPGEVPGLAGGRILLPENPGKEETAAVLEDVCRRLGRDYFPRRVAELAEKWGFSFQSVSVTRARTRWGSCSGKDSLCFSLRLCWAGIQGVDYVILHELAHTQVRNHSPRFWALVADRMPDYRQREAELRELHRRLYLLGL